MHACKHSLSLSRSHHFQQTTKKNNVENHFNKLISLVAYLVVRATCTVASIGAAAHWCTVARPNGTYLVAIIENTRAGTQCT